MLPENTIPKCFFSLLKQKKKGFERFRNQMLPLRIVHILSNIQNTVKIINEKILLFIKVPPFRVIWNIFCKKKFCYEGKEKP